MGTTVVSLSTVLAAGLMLWWRHLDNPAHVRVPDVDPFADVPADLRPAAIILTREKHLEMMWAALGLGSTGNWPTIVGGVDLIPAGAVFDVQVVGGQKLSDWTNDDITDALAQYLGVTKVRVRQSGPGFVQIELRTFDTLAEPVVSVQEATGVDLEAVDTGIREDGRLWLLRVLYAHILLAGATGSGKGSVLWSIIRGIGPAIKAGYVDVWMADPKGGMEFGRGEKLWVRFQWTADGILEMLTEAVQVMENRASTLRSAGIRKHVPTPDAPLVLIVIDEAAALSAYATRDQRQEFERLLGLLLSQGRAVGVSVIAALQDPSKETMPFRQLFPVRIGLRLDEPTQTTMVHGQGSKDRGALCHEIPDTTPGVGYVGEDGTTEFVRVRAYWIDDDQADAIVDAYAPTPAVTSAAADDDFDPSTFDPDFIPGEDDEQQGWAA